jgi:glutaredoxin-like YruB-family protein
MSDVKLTPDPAAQGADPKITIYSTNWCAFCKTEKQYLDRKGIAYVEKNVEEDKEAYEELMKKNGGAFQGVPVTDIAGELVLGFDRLKIDQLIQEKGIQPVAA